MHLHLDCFSGIAGDMMLGALIDLGASAELVVAELEKLDLTDWSVTFPRRDAGHGMHGTGVDVSSPELTSSVVLGGDHHHRHGHDDPMDTQEHEALTDFDTQDDDASTQEWDALTVASLHGAADHDHDHDHHHDHDHGDEGAHDHHHDHHHAHRAYAEIAALIDQADLTERAKTRAQAIFSRIAEAEAKVHAMNVADVQFHEVGAIDSIIDVVGVAVALDLLDVETVSASPLPLGRGFTRSQHGHIPLPAPATLECLAGVPCYDSGLASELVTPTGAGIVGALATSFANFPEMTVQQVGYGAGTRRLGDRPNVVRAVLGRRDAPAALTRDEVWELSANLDDQSPEDLAPAIDALWDAGALDVWLTPIVMKKGRLGQRLSVLCSPDARGQMASAILRHTTSLGVRLTRHERAKLAREVVPTATRYGEIRVKLGRGEDGSVWNLAPEADDCVAAAKAHGVPVKVVRQAAIASAVAALS